MGKYYFENSIFILKIQNQYFIFYFEIVSWKYFILYFQNTFTDYFNRCKILFPKYFFKILFAECSNLLMTLFCWHCIYTVPYRDSSYRRAD